MAMPQNNRQRSTKVERQAAEAVIRELFEKAYELGEVVLDYRNDGKDGLYKAKTLHESCSNFRKKVKKKQTEMFDIWLKVNAIEIKLEQKLVVRLRKKAGAVSDRTQTILDVITKNPELNLLGVSNPVVKLDNPNIAASIAKDFEHSD